MLSTIDRVMGIVAKGAILAARGRIGQMASEFESGIHRVLPI